VIICRNGKWRVNIRLYLIRHGETEYNQQQRIQGGGSNTDLNATGKKQAKNVALYFKDKRIGAVYSSPLKRALFTAKAIAYYHNLNVHIEKDLREIDVGELEGIPITELTSDLSSVILGFDSGDGSKRLPGGESLLDVRERAMAVVDRIIKDNPESAIIVGHYFVVLSIICAVLDLPPANFRRMRIKNGSVSIIDFERGKGILYSLNDTCFQT
jgi:broad specificity phosphatase PhoE